MTVGRYCGAVRKGRKPCEQHRGWGTEHPGYGSCKLHGGSTKAGKVAAAREMAEAMVAQRRFYGDRAVVDPEQALLEEMQYTTGTVRWLREQIAAWVTGAEADVDRAAAITAGMDASFDGDDTEQDRRGVLDEAIDARTGLPQLVAVHSTLRAIGFTDTEYAAWLKVFHREREQLVRVAKACIDANVQERRQQVLEARAQMMQAVLGEVIRLLGIKVTPDRMAAVMQQAIGKVATQIEGQVVSVA